MSSGAWREEQRDVYYEPNRTKRLGGYARWALLVTAGLAVLMVIGGDWMRERSQLYRAVTWLDADVGDLYRFPSRPIPRGDTVDPLRQGSGHDYLFDSVRVVSDGDTVAWDFDEFLAAQHTWGFLLLRGDSIIHERYFDGKNEETLFTTFSLSKSVLSAAVGAAVDRGLIGGLQDPVTKYVPELQERDPGFSRITLGHLMGMASGLAYDGSSTPWSDDARTYYAPDLRGAALESRIAEAPGRTFHYNNFNALLVGLALERATGRTLSEFFSETIWSLLGTEADASWSLDSDTHGFEKMESGFNARARDLARFGRLFLRNGVGPSGRILSDAWVEASVAADSVSEPNVRYLNFWWINPVENGPAEFYAEGRFGQFVYVVPDLDLVIVRVGRDDGIISWRSFLSGQAARIREAEGGG
jgi:CubicO group peptidase (beta-lactamase class C family)